MAAADESMMMIEVRGKQLEEKGKSAMEQDVAGEKKQLDEEDKWAAELLEAGEHQSVIVMTADPGEGPNNQPKSIQFGAGTSFSDVLSYKVHLVTMQHMMEKNGRGRHPLYTAYNTWMTAAEMLSDRGYIVDESQFNAQQFGSLLDAAQRNSKGGKAAEVSILAKHSLNPQDKALVHILSHFSGAATLDAIADRFPNANPSKIIIVSHTQSCNLHNFQALVAGHPVSVEAFHISELFLNLVRRFSEHQYQLLTPDDLKRKRSLQLSSLPARHPVPRYFGLKRGEFLKSTSDKYGVRYLIVV